MPRQLDLRAACEAFVAVAERESFTAGATAAGVTQSVASRRVAALEDHLGARLFDRSSRRVALTAFGRGVLPSAVKLVTAAQELSDDAGRASRLTVTVGVPLHTDAAAAARLRAAAGAQQMLVDLVPGLPAERAEALGTGRLQLALEHVEPDRARWSTRLGVATARMHESATDFFFAELRPRRGRSTVRRLWLQPEDDAPAVRDRVERVRNGAGLVPSQLRIAASVVGAMSEAIGGDDLVLCSVHEAREFGLGWRPLGDVHLMRGYALSSRDGDLAARFTTAAGPLLAAMLRSDGADDAVAVELEQQGAGRAE
jgi:DNA-binding transcriptional LysR family regulator